MTSDEAKQALKEGVSNPFKPIKFKVNKIISIEIRDYDKDLYAIIDSFGDVFNGTEWEHEPLPSSRTDEFKARTRFPLEKAVEFCKEINDDK